MRPILISLTMALSLFSMGVHADARDFEEWFGGNFMLDELIDSSRGYCLDLEGFASTTDTSKPVIVHSCKEGYWKDGTWRVNYPEVGKIYLPEYGLCLTAAALEHNSEMVLAECGSSPMQNFIFHSNAKVEIISGDDQKLCLAVGETSRPAGVNLRRQTRVAECDTTPDQYTRWILPSEDAIYTDFSVFVPPETSQAAAQAPRGGDRGSNGGSAVSRMFNGACATCHGPNASGLASEFAPKLSGQEDWYLIRQMRNFANGLRGGHEGERWATQMLSYFQDANPAQVEDFAALISDLEDTPSATTIKGDVARGQQLYTTSCTACHGADAMGNIALNAPRLAGMSDWYTVIQLKKFRYDYRGDHPEDTLGAQMAAFAKMLPDDQALKDVTAYINTLSYK